MMSAWQARSVLRAAGLWKSSEMLTRTHGCVLSLVPSLQIESIAITRSLFVCSRSLPSPQNPPLPSNSASHGRGLLGASSVLIPKSSCVCFTRGKAKKSGRKHYKQKQDEVESDTDNEDDDMELESGNDFREMKVRVPSLRVDAILKAGLNMSRNKVESAFYSSRIYINGKKLLKKSHLCHEGDEIDVLKTVSRHNPNNLYVSRVVMVTLGHVAEEENVSLKLRCYPNLLVECYEDFKGPEQQE